jgi:hypothetical protein
MHATHEGGSATVGMQPPKTNLRTQKESALNHLLPAGLHGRFIAHLVRTRPVHAVLWHDPGPDPVGLVEISDQASDDLLLGAVTRPDGHVPAGLNLHLIVRPDGSLSGAERLGMGLRPALVR